jgi:hypothetical protein
VLGIRVYFLVHRSCLSLLSSIFDQHSGIPGLSGLHIERGVVMIAQTSTRIPGKRERIGAGDITIAKIKYKLARLRLGYREVDWSIALLHCQICWLGVLDNY